MLFIRGLVFDLTFSLPGPGGYPNGQTDFSYSPAASMLILSPVRGNQPPNLMRARPEEYDVLRR